MVAYVKYLMQPTFSILDLQLEGSIRSHAGFPELPSCLWKGLITVCIVGVDTLEGQVNQPPSYSCGFTSFILQQYTLLLHIHGTFTGILDRIRVSRQYYYINTVEEYIQALMKASMGR